MKHICKGFSGGQKLWGTLEQEPKKNQKKLKALVLHKTVPDNDTVRKKL